MKYTSFSPNVETRTKPQRILSHQEFCAVQRGVSQCFHCNDKKLNEPSQDRHLFETRPRHCAYKCAFFFQDIFKEALELFPTPKLRSYLVDELYVKALWLTTNTKGFTVQSTVSQNLNISRRTIAQPFVPRYIHICAAKTTRLLTIGRPRKQSAWWQHLPWSTVSTPLNPYPRCTGRGVQVYY